MMELALQQDKIKEINSLHSSAISHAKSAIENAIRIGELLTDIKGGLEHGLWIPWVRKNLSFGVNQAGKYMKVFKEKDALNSHSNVNLTLSGAITLLAEPRPEPEEPDDDGTDDGAGGGLDQEGDIQHVEVVPEEVEDVEFESAPTLERAAEIEVERGGRTYTQQSQEKQGKPVLDRTRRNVPEHLEDVFRRLNDMMSYGRQIAHLKSEILDRAAGDPVFALLHTQSLETALNNAHQAVMTAVPYAVCPYCGADSKDCRACRGLGFVNHVIYDSAPKEIKA